MSNKAKVWPVIENEGDKIPYSFMFLCPGCNGYHSLNTLKPNEKGAMWQFNGNLVAPTFSPSLNVKYIFDSPEMKDIVCHSFIRDGYIQFLNDCTHKMAGITTELPEVD